MCKYSDIFYHLVGDSMISTVNVGLKWQIFIKLLQDNIKIVMKKTAASSIAEKKNPPYEGSGRLFKANSLKQVDSIIISNYQRSTILGRQKLRVLSKSIQQKLLKATEYCKGLKQQYIQPRKLIRNSETPSPNLKSYRQESKLVSISTLIRPKSYKNLQPSTHSKINRHLSGVKKEEIEKLEEVREIQSFLDDDNQLEQEVSIVQGHGTGVLDWGTCVGKASEFRVLRFLDEGKCGRVYLAQSHRNHMIYSVKSIYRHSLDQAAFQQLIREIKIQTYLKHPHIVQLYHFFVDQQAFHLVLEPCLGKNLFQQIKEKGRIPEKTVKEWIRQICSAVLYMHKNDIIHRDLKPQNILLHENIIKICDFGWAIHSPLMRNTQCGTPLYNPPQVVQKSAYDSKIDIWSIGILTYQLLYGTIPFQIRHMQDMIKIIQQEVYFSSQTVVSEAGKDFMIGCLQKNPQQRYDIRQLVEHQFLNKMEKYRWTII